MSWALRRLPVARCAHFLLRSRVSTGTLEVTCRASVGGWDLLKRDLSFNIAQRTRRLSALPMVDIDESSNSSVFLGGKEDRYGGFIIDSESLPDNTVDFSEILGKSLEHWKNIGLRGIWLKIPIDRARFVGPSVDTHQFVFHHAEEGHVMLVRWLPDEDHHLPPNASHQVGIGAYVVNDEGHMLAVQERNGPLKGLNVWKLPTGLVNEREDVSDAAVREVFEETGIKAEFQAIIAVRQAHGYLFGKSDMFFLCALKPLPGEMTLKKEDREIEDVQWMPFDEFIGQEFMAQRATFKKMLSRCWAFTQGKYKGLLGKRLTDGFRRKSDFVMWGPGDSDSDDGGAEIVQKKPDGAKL
ncbi:hypothetical protein BSKO_08163 [Bryopsis sp. KO-2023]|nr:hypothetical protein BSKO_08163 [Bryopsis sp. KO-2023]